jgi:hypothetical protein
MKIEKYSIERCNVMKEYTLFENVISYGKRISVDESEPDTYEKKYLFTGSLSDIYAFIQLNPYLKL